MLLTVSSLWVQFDGFTKNLLVVEKRDHIQVETRGKKRVGGGAKPKAALISHKSLAPNILGHILINISSL